MKTRWQRFDKWMQESWMGNLITALVLALGFLGLFVWFALPE